MSSHTIQPGARAPMLLLASTSADRPGRHRRLRAPVRLLRKVFAVAEKLGRTASIVAMLTLTSAALLLAVNPPDNGSATPSVPAAAYNE